MKLKHADIIIPENEPFKNCKLNRKKYAEILTSIVGSYADGFVLAINNEWGTGKTTFVKMWQQHLKNKEFKTLYFNAWENDYDSDPLVAILAELKKLTGDTDNKVFKSVLDTGVKLTKSIFPIILKAIAQKYIEIDAIKEAIGEISKDATEMFKEEVKEYAAKRDGLIEFKKKLEGYIKKESKSKPVIFIIDELDRCRPDYAVEVLEKVKHFFNIPGIVFILSIDKMQLGNAIRGFYGSEKINADEYLKRFIDIEYKIPKPNSKEVCSYFYDYFDFYEFFISNGRSMSSQEFREDEQRFIEFASNIIENQSLSLRQQEKLFAHARLALKLFKTTNYLFPNLFFWLIYIREFDLDLYKKIKDQQILPQTLYYEIERKLNPFTNDENERIFIHTESILLFLYNNDYKELHLEYKLIQINNNVTSTLKLDVNNDIQKEQILSWLQKFQKENFNRMKLSQLLSKIELLEDLIS